MKSLEENYALFKKLNTVAFGVGVDSTASNKAWTNSMEIKKTPILSDFWPHGELAQLYGIFRDKEGVSERANIIIDENQKVIFARIYPDKVLPDIKEIIRILG
jgi:alkyl hydroperoxide reductase subunit AhpC